MTSPHPADATRIVYWNIPGHEWMYALLLVALAVFAYGLNRRMRTILRGGPLRLDARAAARALRVTLSQRLVRRDRAVGWWHAVFFFGFLLLFVGTVVVFIDTDLHVPVMRGWFYLVFQSFVLDVAGAASLLACAIVLVQRAAGAPRRTAGRAPGYTADLAVLTMLLLTGFLIHGLRIAAQHDPWGPYAPVSDAVAALARPLSLEAQLGSHRALWWVHMVLLMGWFASWPYTRMRHNLFAPLSLWQRASRGEAAVTPPVDFEAEGTLGLATAGGLDGMQRLALEACTECGRCEAACPAFAAEGVLSPRNVVLGLRDALDLDRDLPAVEAAGGRHAMWACTTCRACEETCPVGISPVTYIMQIRQHLTMEEGYVPAGIEKALANIETRGHPFAGLPVDRTGWAAGLDLIQVGGGSNEPVDVVFWAGCAVATNARSAEIARTAIDLFRRAGLRVGTLGELETCNGDIARRAGHELTFTTQADVNVRTLADAGNPALVSICPHCVNSLGRDYAQRGFTMNVKHHTDLLAELIAADRLPKAAASRANVTYHDPCYLGRYGGMLDAPRSVLDAGGVAVIEMPRNGRSSFCCGGGGAQIFNDGKGPATISLLRAKEAATTGAPTLATGCPFCSMMLTEASERDGSGIGVRDVSEIYADQLTDRRDDA